MTPAQRVVARELAACASSLFHRGYSFGTAGNLSARADDILLVSPTNSSFEELHEESFAIVGYDGTRSEGPAPSKEVHFHLSLYAARPDAGAVVHLHSTYATAVACLPCDGAGEILPVYTPYFAMRIPCLPVVPYLPPGHPGLARHVHAAAERSPAILLKNHGPVTAGRTIREASALAEELEEQCRLYFLLGDRGERLTPEQIAVLRNGAGR
jgi:ribulose-5-phosphate 4-epimerase/fuculose-1-phosphate aldolase